MGAFLPVVSAVLARNVFINFGERIFPNLYSILVSQTGLRKSTTVQLVTHIAATCFPKRRSSPASRATRRSFSEYLTHPDKLWLIDEGNVILDNWAHDAAGKGVARQVLALYDCPPWRESYLKHKEKEGKAIQEVPADKHLDPDRRDASRARVSAPWRRATECAGGSITTRVSAFGRMIPWPLSYDSRELIEFTGALEGLKNLKGEMRLSPEAFELWKQLQVENRRQIEAVSGIDPASETHGSMLAVSPVKTLKLAMIFEVCRWAQRQDEGLAGHPGGHPGPGGQARGLLRRGKQEPRCGSGARHYHSTNFTCC